MTKKRPSPDIYANLTLYSQSEGGKTLAIKDEFGCPAKIDADFFDCRIYLYNDEVKPGAYKEKVPIKFLSPELVQPLLKTGDKFFLWESKIFGEAVVTDIFFNKKCIS